jgi:hypothetical protein
MLSGKNEGGVPGYKFNKLNGRVLNVEAMIHRPLMVAYPLVIGTS